MILMPHHHGDGDMILILMPHHHVGMLSKIPMPRHRVRERKILTPTSHLLVVGEMTPTPTCHLLVGTTKTIPTSPLHAGR